MFLSVENVIDLHDEAIGEYGGTPGLRDAGALASALAQPAMEAFGVEMYPGIVEKAAAYLYFISRNHAFLDGNKRTSYAATYAFLLLNGFVLDGPDGDVFALVLDSAQGRLSDPRAVAEQLLPLVHPFWEE
ncbi:type II toxin-antitoxin system death-on-curing family toxin [uncultured Deinococcus sp.]|uniref:type II toxin-antitoxin system death-on-curing family toxin n=1 Tax=uncultured Deinococcus sp. TaxID=158789 RepID=UPI0025E0AD73|nr:type II toxin-antitoxin system death-on-curing family toxin [uncultured Deinococcus sp.]